MNISVWIIVFILLAFAFWIYFKKNKHIIENKNINNKNIKKNKLNNLEKMIQNLANDQQYENLSEKKNINTAEPTDSTEKKEFDKKGIIKNSVILERRKKK